MTRRLLVALLAIVSVVGLAACGDDGGGIEEETTTTAEETTTTEEGDDGGDDAGDDADDAGDDSAGGDLPDGQAPGDLGDDSALDAVADTCFEGDMGACDVLYFVSEGGSDYELYADTCGGRQDAGTGDLCTEVFDFDLPDGQAPGTLGDDADLDDLAEECFDGDMDSCDELYGDSPSGSDYEVYAVTCGGRLPASAGAALLDLVSAQGSAFCADAYGNAA